MRQRNRRVPEDDEQSIRGDLTPMIDIIFLLLIFFLLTTKFVVPERVIGQLLPTDKGSQNTVSKDDTDPDLVIRVYPAGLHPGMGVTELAAQWRDALNADQAVVQVGGHPPLVIDGRALMQDLSAQALDPQLAALSEYLHTHLQAAELPGPRDEQRTVAIHCFSALSWKYAAVVYDAVRAYEQTQAPDLRDLRQAREVQLAPPRIRQYATMEQGNELWEILHASL